MDWDHKTVVVELNCVQTQQKVFKTVLGGRILRDQSNSFSNSADSSSRPILLKPSDIVFKALMMDYTVSFELKSTQETFIFIFKLLLGILREQNCETFFPATEGLKFFFANGLVRSSCGKNGGSHLTYYEQVPSKNLVPRTPQVVLSALPNLITKTT